MLAPIASVVGTSFAAWEAQSDLNMHEVLAMMDKAIAFAVQAEHPPPDILAEVGALIARLN
jgi:hypothetical protein